MQAAASLKIFFAAIMFVMISSCGKSGSSSPTPPNGGGGGGAVPTMNISTPTAGQIFFLNDTVRIAATASSPYGLYGYTVTIKRVDNNAVVFSTANNTQAASYNILEKWKNPLNTYTELEAEVSVVTDTNNNNKMTRSVVFHVH